MQHASHAGCAYRLDRTAPRAEQAPWQESDVACHDAGGIFGDHEMGVTMNMLDIRRHARRIASIASFMSLMPAGCTGSGSEPTDGAAPSSAPAAVAVDTADLRESLRVHGSDGSLVSDAA